MEHIPLYDGQAIRELAATLVRKARQESRRYDKAATRYRLLQYVLLSSMWLFPCAAAVIGYIPTIPKGVSSSILGLFVLALGAVKLVKPIQRCNAIAEAIAVELTEFSEKHGPYEELPEEVALRRLQEQLDAIPMVERYAGRYRDYPLF